MWSAFKTLKFIRTLTGTRSEAIYFLICSQSLHSVRYNLVFQMCELCWIFPNVRSVLDTTRFSGRLKRKFRSLGSDGDISKPVKLKRNTETATKISSESQNRVQHFVSF